MTKKQTQDNQAQQDFVILAIDNLHAKVVAFRDWATDNYNPDELAFWVEDVTRLTEELDLIEYQIESDSWGDEND